MGRYFGTKEILARPMSRQAYNDYRGWELPADEDGSDEGYLVEYVDGGASNHPDHAGYISWSPADVFERAYQTSGSLSFGHALEALKAGYRVARSGWNGKGMWLGLVIPQGGIKVELSDITAITYEVLPHIVMKTADNKVVPWLASQTDMLSEDWMLI